MRRILTLYDYLGNDDSLYVMLTIDGLGREIMGVYERYSLSKLKITTDENDPLDWHIDTRDISLLYYEKNTVACLYSKLVGITPNVCIFDYVHPIFYTIKEHIHLYINPQYRDQLNNFLYEILNALSLI